MKPFLLFLTTAALLSVSTIQAQIPAATPQQAVVYFFDALAELSDAKMRAYVSADFLLLEDGAVWNTDSLSVRMARRNSSNFKRINSFRFIRTDVQGANAVAAYHNHADITIDGKLIPVDWLESVHLVKEGEGWKIRMMHSTPVKPKK